MMPPRFGGTFRFALLGALLFSAASSAPVCAEPRLLTLDIPSERVSAPVITHYPPLVVVERNTSVYAFERLRARLKLYEVGLRSFDPFYLELSQFDGRAIDKVPYFLASGFYCDFITPDYLVHVTGPLAVGKPTPVVRTKYAELTLRYGAGQWT
jgi:hypothetical protein